MCDERKRNTTSALPRISCHFISVIYILVSFEIVWHSFLCVPMNKGEGAKDTIFTMMNGWEPRTSVFCVFLLTLIGLREPNAKFNCEFVLDEWLQRIQRIRPIIKIWTQMMNTSCICIQLLDLVDFINSFLNAHQFVIIMRAVFHLREIQVTAWSSNEITPSSKCNMRTKKWSDEKWSDVSKSMEAGSRTHTDNWSIISK